MDTVYRNRQGDTSESTPRKTLLQKIEQNTDLDVILHRTLTCICVVFFALIIIALHPLMKFFLVLGFGVSLWLLFVHSSEVKAERDAYADCLAHLLVQTNKHMLITDADLARRRNELDAVQTDLADAMMTFKRIERRHYSRMSPKQLSKVSQ